MEFSSKEVLLDPRALVGAMLNAKMPST